METVVQLCKGQPRCYYYCCCIVSDFCFWCMKGIYVISKMCSLNCSYKYSSQRCFFHKWHMKMSLFPNPFDFSNNLVNTEQKYDLKLCDTIRMQEQMLRWEKSLILLLKMPKNMLYCFYSGGLSQKCKAE